MGAGYWTGKGKDTISWGGTIEAENFSGDGINLTGVLHSYTETDPAFTASAALYVPYTNATGDVDLGAYYMKATRGYYPQGLFDGSDMISYDTGNRQIVASTGSTIIDAENNILYAADGTDPILNFYTPGTADFGDSEITTTGSVTAYKDTAVSAKFGSNWWANYGTTFAPTDGRDSLAIDLKVTADPSTATTRNFLCISDYTGTAALTKTCYSTFARSFFTGTNATNSGGVGGAYYVAASNKTGTTLAYAYGCNAETEIMNNTTGTITKGAAYTGRNVVRGTMTEGIVFYAQDANKVSGTFTTQYGIKVDKQTKGAICYGLSLNGDGVGADICFGAGQDAKIYYDGTNLVVNPKVVGSGLLSISGDVTSGVVTADTYTEIASGAIWTLMTAGDTISGAHIVRASRTAAERVIHAGITDGTDGRDQAVGIAESDAASGASVWVATTGRALVYCENATTTGDFIQCSATSSGAALSSAYPASPADANHWREVGHSTTTTTGAGYIKAFIHFN